MNNNAVSIVYIGDTNIYTRSFMRLSVLKSLGHHIYEKSSHPVSESGLIDKPTILVRIFHRLRLDLDSVGINRWLLSTVEKRTDVQLIFIDKGINIYPWTLARLKNINKSARLIFISEDDMIAKHNKSYWFALGLKYYDHNFTTKSFNIDELRKRGGRRVHLISDSYCKKIHFPCKLTSDEEKNYSVDVSAIGQFEKERYDSLLYIAKKGVKVTIWGNGWDDHIGKHHNLDIRGEHLYNDEYSKAISGSKINLNFLRKINRDTITSRSIEIPACGGFMLTERTDRQTELFGEGVEAEYFSSDEELLEKIKYYLVHVEKRERIARNGYDKCIAGKLSMEDVLLNIINTSLHEYD